MLSLKNSIKCSFIFAIDLLGSDVNKTKRNAVIDGNTNESSTTITTGGETHNYVKPRTANTIVCFKEKPEGVVYDAAFLVKSIKAKHGI